MVGALSDVRYAEPVRDLTVGALRCRSVKALGGLDVQALGDPIEVMAEGDKCPNFKRAVQPPWLPFRKIGHLGAANFPGDDASLNSHFLNGFCAGSDDVPCDLIDPIECALPSLMAFRAVLTWRKCLERRKGALEFAI
jgi:hypothetical protein